MRKVFLSLAAAAALTCASASNAAITLEGHSSDVSVGTPNNSTIPNKVNFDSVTNTAATINPWFDFKNDQDGFYVFDLTSSTLYSSITLEKVLSDGGTTLVNQVIGSGRFLELITPTLDADTVYRFTYTYNTPDGGGTVSGNASFYPAVPEPATWAMMLIGFGGIAMAMRRRGQGMALAQVA